MYEYRFMRCEQADVEGLLEKYAAAGWRVHTFSVSGAMACILWEREKETNWGSLGYA